MSKAKKLVSKTIHGLVYKHSIPKDSDGNPQYDDVVATLHYLQGKDVPMESVVPLFCSAKSYALESTEPGKYIILEPTDQKERIQQYQEELESWENEDHSEATMLRWFSDFIKSEVTDITEIPKTMQNHFNKIEEDKKEKWLPAKPEDPGVLERTIVVLHSEDGIRYVTSNDSKKTLEHYGLSSDNPETQPTLE